MIALGTKIYGFCGGMFGRDSYEDKIVLATGVYGETVWAALGALEPVSYCPPVYIVYGEDVTALERYTEPEEEPDYG